MLLKIKWYIKQILAIPCSVKFKILLKNIWIGKIVETVLEKMGDVNQIFLIGDYAKGIDSNMVEILIIGNKFNVEYIKELKKN